MRIRTVKPEFWSHRMHQVLSEPAAMLALALLNLADDEGRFEAHPQMIAARLFVYRPLSRPVKDCMQELVKVGFVALYRATLDGLEVELGVVRNFRRHQVISRPTRSTLPPPSHNGSPGSLHDDSMSAHGSIDGSLHDDSMGKEGRKEGTKEGKEGESTRARTFPSEVPSVEEVIAHGRGPAGIPEEYCRHFHRKRTTGRYWFNGAGDLKDWQQELVDWFAKDRHRWQAENKKTAGQDLRRWKRRFQKRRTQKRAKFC
jgi:hypothetical protein